jgi:hypothetical protein
MMKSLILITLLSLFFVFSCYGQDKVLLLTKKKNQKEKTIEEGRKMKVYTNKGSVFHERFHVISDSLIVLKNDTVALSEIEKIRSKSTASKVVGGIFAGSGGIVTIFGSMILIEMVSEGGLTALVGMILGVPVTATGVIVATTGALFLTIGKKYKQNKWEFRIKNVANSGKDSL